MSQARKQLQDETQPLVEKKDKKQIREEKKLAKKLAKEQKKHDQDEKKRLKEEARSKAAEKKKSKPKILPAPRLNIQETTVESVNPVVKENQKKMAEIFDNIRNKVLPLPSETQGVLLSEYNRLNAITKSAHDPDKIKEEIDRLDQTVNKYRRENVEATERKLVSQALDEIEKQVEQAEDLQKRVQILSVNADQFTETAEPKAKPKGNRFSLFACLPCCGSQNDSDNENNYDDGKKPLLSNRKQ